jgi:hypothetical protein
MTDYGDYTPITVGHTTGSNTLPDADAAFDRAIAEAEARGYRAGRKHERDLICAFMEHMDSEGKFYAEQILAVIRSRT